MVTLAPSTRQSPAWRLVRCTKRSSEPSSAVMKPKPFSSRHCFTVPVHLLEVASLVGCCESLLPPTGSCPTAAGASAVSAEALAVSAEALAASAEALVVVAESTAGEPSAASAVSKGAPTSVAAGTSATFSLRRWRVDAGPLQLGLAVLDHWALRARPGQGARRGAHRVNIW